MHSHIYKLLVAFFTLVGAYKAAATPPVVEVETHYAGRSFIQDGYKYRLVYCIDAYCDRATVPSVEERSREETVTIVYNGMVRAIGRSSGEDGACGDVTLVQIIDPDHLVDFIRYGEHNLQGWSEEALTSLGNYTEQNAGYLYARHFVSRGCDDDKSYDHVVVYSAKTGYVTDINTLPGPPRLIRRFFH